MPFQKKEHSGIEIDKAGYLRPENFGFQQVDPRSWQKELAGKDTIFSVVDWKNIPALEEVTSLQGQVWGMGARDLVPSNLLAIAGDTGGDVVVARNNSGQLEGFVFTMGTIDGKLILHMIGVNPSLRYRKDLGWNLSLIQAALAKAKGIAEIDWTYDPLRGSNARLNLEKLGAVGYKYTVNKYGRVSSELYGENPTDRFTVRWNLNEPATKKRLNGIHTGSYQPLTLNDVANLPIIAEVGSKSLPNKFLVEIPYDVDSLSAADSAAWRVQLRQVCSQVMTSETASDYINRRGLITGFATGLDGSKKRSFYVVQSSPSLR